MKKLFLIVGWLLCICSPSSAMDVQDFLRTDTDGYAATVLDRIRNVMGQNHDATGDRFSQGIHTGVVQASSHVKAIMDEFTMKGLASPYVEDTSNGEDKGDGMDDDLPFFPGEGSGTLPEQPDGDWSAWSNDDWGWFYYPSNNDVSFNPLFWSEE